MKLSKNKKRWFARIGRVLRKAFGPILGRGSPPLENPPRTPGKGHLYESKKPYGPGHLPPSRAAAKERLAWRREQVDDWFDRGLGERYKRVSHEIRQCLYERRKHTYHGQPEAVMAAAIKETKFLRRWIERACGPPTQPRSGRDRQRPRQVDTRRRPSAEPRRPSRGG